MSDDSDKNVQKWTCDYCTYQNYPSSLKCTMCKIPGSKPLLSEDIFRLSPPQTAFDGDEDQNGATADVVDAREYNACATDTVTTDASLATSSSGKWSCSICTYSNWPRSQRCVQCYTKRSAISLSPATTTTTNTRLAETAVKNKHEINQETAAIAINKTNNEKILQQQHHQQQLQQQQHNINRIEDELKSIRLTSDSQLNACNLLDSKKFEENDSNSIIQQQQQQHQQQQYAKSAIVGGATNRDLNTTHLNNLANTSYNQQQQQTQTTTTTTTTTATLQQQHCYTAKWACNVCTYENWPKSLKCSMCGKPKEISSTPQLENNACGVSNKIICEKDENHDTVSTNNCFNKSKHIYQLGSSETINNCDTLQERQERRQRQIRRQVDWQWLNACLGVVENNYSAVEAYLSCGGNPARSLTSTEIAALNRNSAFDVGHTLIHLAIRFHREEMLPMLLAKISGSGPGIKRVPSYIAPDLAADIRRHFANTLRLRKTVMNCHYVQEHATFALPASEIEELPTEIQEQLYEELLDRDAQKQLENPPPALNWSSEITSRLGSRLAVLWNRSAGDCLLDSAMQATWGVFDRDNILRRALSDTLNQCGHIFYPRWREYEMLQASLLHFTLEEAQWQEDWSTLLNLASQPGSSLEQLHIFALAHILRRPIIVYGVKYVKSFRGEDIGYARFEGLYLPLFWEQNFCIKSPIALGYTRGHFSALVPMEPYVRRDEPEDVTYLPLMDCESKLLPIHFLKQSEMGREEAIMRQWLDVCVTEGGLLVALQKIRKRPLLVAQMLEEWLNHYRRIAQVISAPFVRRPQQTGYSSDGDSDEE